MTKELVSANALQRLEDTSTEFIDCMHTLLEATRVITYS